MKRFLVVVALLLFGGVPLTAQDAPMTKKQARNYLGTTLDMVMELELLAEAVKDGTISNWSLARRRQEQLVYGYTGEVGLKKRYVRILSAIDDYEGNFMDSELASMLTFGLRRLLGFSGDIEDTVRAAWDRTTPPPVNHVMSRMAWQYTVLVKGTTLALFEIVGGTDAVIFKIAKRARNRASAYIN